MKDLILTLENGSDISVDVSGGEKTIELALGEASGYPTYTGATEFTPTQETQIAFTAGKVVLEDIVINAIPYNYGLVTYQGNIITVS